MFEKLEEVAARFDELTAMMGEPEIASDMKRFTEIAKERSRMEATVGVYRQYCEVDGEIADLEELLADDSDADMQEMVAEERTGLLRRRESLTEELKVLLIPRDPLDEKNTILEIRAGTGGDEASLFSSDLMRMYSRFAEGYGWKVEVLSSSAGSVGGFKEVIALITGEQVYSHLKHESGVHRVQRVPATESQGRIHTSACTVAVLPEAEELEMEIAETDLRFDVYRSSGPGGQSVNTTDSAVRITHIPTGLVVTCQDEKSQHKNKAKGLKILRSRLFDMEKARLDKERSDERKSMVGSGDRSERIRTYNFPQNRLTDHRIELTLHKLDQIMEGEALREVIEALAARAQADAMSSGGGEGV